MYTVDIDTGGTMTDGLVWDGTTMVTVKVDTTPHDLTVSFRELLGEAARQLGFGGDLGAFLDEVSLICWSSTITSNTLGERKGAKLGLLVRPGSERSLYGEGPSPAVGTLVAERNVIGVDADADGQGVLDAVRRLLEDGARRICVSLDSFPETRQEQAVKRIIETQYRDHYLGSVPVLLASDMAQVDDGQTRTHYALINAYVHGQLATSLFKAEDLLRYDEGWTGALLVGHTNGGVARVGNKPGGVYLDNFVLKVTVPTAKPALPDLDLQPADAGAALTGKRPAWWPGQGWTETSIYEADALRPGHQIDGPVIVEAPLTTVVVPPGMRYRIDRHGLGLLKAAENGGAR